MLPTSDRFYGGDKIGLNIGLIGGLKKFLSFIVVFSFIFGIAITASASNPYTVEIKVEGTSGVPFSGTYGDSGSSKSVDGTVPETYTIEDPEGDFVSCTFQKNQTSGKMTVKIVKDGEVKTSGTVPDGASGETSLSWKHEEDSGCFIATAAYGTEKDRRLRPLRNFRDEILLTNNLGKRVVKTYYNASPPIAESMREHETMKKATKYLTIIPASIGARIITSLNSLILVGALLLILMFLSYRFGRLNPMIKSISAAISTLILGIGLILILGKASYLWSGFATIAVYTLPFLIPITALTTIWVIKENFRKDARFCTKW